MLNNKDSFDSEMMMSLAQLFQRHHLPNRAASVEAYMKHKFEFFGFDATTRKQLQRVWLSEQPKQWLQKYRWDIVAFCWEQPQREFHYFAIDFMNTWPKQWMDQQDAEQLEFFLTHESWWDSVDAIASNYLGKWFQQFPIERDKTIEKWRNSENFWLHRSCLIFQLKYKNEVDVLLLKSLIQQFMPNKEFFIQKAIGWSLRQLSKTQPETVKQLISELDIKGLAQREASKYL